MSARPARGLLTILMNLLIVLAVLVTASIVVAFFGALAARSWGEAIIRIADLVTIPFGIELLKTPYGGVFDADGALTVGLMLLAEWALSVMRSRA